MSAKHRYRPRTVWIAPIQARSGEDAAAVLLDVVERLNRHSTSLRHGLMLTNRITKEAVRSCGAHSLELADAHLLTANMHLNWCQPRPARFYLHRALTLYDRHLSSPDGRILAAYLGLADAAYLQQSFGQRNADAERLYRFVIGQAKAANLPALLFASTRGLATSVALACDWYSRDAVWDEYRLWLAQRASVSDCSS